MRLHAAKVLSASGVGLTSAVAAGTEWTADQGYDVGSLSLGGASTYTTEQACRYTSDEGVVWSPRPATPDRVRTA